MDPLATGIIANFIYNFIRGHSVADRAFDGLKEILFGDAKTVQELKERMWNRLYSHKELLNKVRVYLKAPNRIHSLIDLAETFDKVISQDEPTVRTKVDEALNYLRKDKDAYNEIIHKLQLSMLWELLERSPPQALKKREEDLIRDYGEKLRNRCQELDLFGVRGASDVGVQLESIFVTLFFFRDIPAGGVPRIHRDDFLNDERVVEYLSPYRSQETIKADELFAHPPRNAILILGMPGAGKTTLLKYQSLRYLESFQNPSEDDSQIYLPIFIRLRTFVKHEGHLIDRISAYLKEDTGEPFDNELMENYLQGGDVAIFYDGLDEIANVAERNKMTGDITTFAKDYPKALHVVTCRIAAYPEITGVDMSSLAKFTIDDMNENQRRDFIHKWYRARASQWKGENVDSLADTLIEKIENSPSIRRLAVNPLLLTIMAIIYSDLRNLPDTRLRLYEECVHVLMHRRDEATGQPAVDRFRNMMPQPEYILGELGYGLHQDSETLSSGIAEPPREDIQSRIAEIIIKERRVSDDKAERHAIRSREVPKFCRFIDERTSILVDRGMGRYGFVHQTFQEYFAAYYLNILELEEVWNEIKDKIWNSHWRQVLLLLSEMLAQRRRALDRLLEKIMAEAKAKKDRSHLLLLADIVIQGTPVTDVFKATVLRALYEKCREDGKFDGDYALKLEELGAHGLNDETYTLITEYIEGTSDTQRLGAIRYFSLRNDLLESYIEQFEKSVEPYTKDSKVRELLLPLLGDLKHLAAQILRLTDIESIINPWTLPPVLPLYYRILTESKQFDELSCVLTKVSAGFFAYSSSLTLLALARARPRVRALARALDLDLARALVRALARARDLDLALALDLYLNLDVALALVRALALDLALVQALARARDLDLNLVRALVRALALVRPQIPKQTIAMIDAEPFFHGAMIHTATLIEILSKEGEELPSHLAYALKKPIDPGNPYLRAAQLFRRFIRREITPEEEGEFQRLLNIEDEKIRHLFDLAYLTEPQTREPIFRFIIADRDE